MTQAAPTTMAKAQDAAPGQRGESITDGHAGEVTEEQLRRWLSLLRRTDRLAEMEDLHPLLALHDRLPEKDSGVELGRAAADLLRDAIEGLRPAADASREEWVSYEVLKTCFLDGAKRWQAANMLGMSERQMSRERARAIRLLKAELEAPAADGDSRHRPEPIPAILGFLPRPALSRKLGTALAEHRLLRVHGPAGAGKTSLVAEFATAVSERTPTLWFRLRAGVNDSLEALLFELGEHLRVRRWPDLTQYIAKALPTPDPALATRLALKGLAGSSHLLVLDDYHLVDEDQAISGFLEEAVARLPNVRIALVGRHRDTAHDTGASLTVPGLTRAETQALLTQLGIKAAPHMAASVHQWTEGIPHLVKLAASWLKTVSPSEIDEELESLGVLEEAQAFFLDSITELMGPEERVVLEAASVFRNRFTDDALAFVAQRTRGEVQDTSRWLVRAYVATRSRGGDVAFFHNSVRDYVYVRLGPERRIALHTRAAAWYERQGEDREAQWHHGRLSALDDDTPPT